MSLRILRTVFRDGAKYRVGVITQHRELHQIGRIEHHVGILLIWIYPFFFRIYHIRPLTNGLDSRERSLVIVAHYPTKQSVVYRRYAVVIIEAYAGKGGDEDAELARIVYSVGKSRIQRVNTLYEKYASLFQAKFLSVILAFAGSEVICRYFHFLAGKQAHYVFLKGLVVHGVEIIEVVLAIRQKRRVHSVYEVVVGREGYRRKAARAQLDAQSTAESGLTRTAWPGN